MTSLKATFRSMSRDWTFGAEHEWADWHLSTLPEIYALNKNDYTIVNSNGIANDPTGKHYKYGGEINTLPSSIENQLIQVDLLKNRLQPSPTINYRSNLHIHVRIPGIEGDLDTLIKLQRYIHYSLPHILKKKIEPMPDWKSTDPEINEGMKRRLRRMRQSHQTFLTPHRLQYQLEATSLQEFFEREVPKDKKGNVMWHAQPRLAVNLRQLRDTGTIEFRHFPGTLNSVELRTCFDWCRDFLCCALLDINLSDFYEEHYSDRRFPKFEPYQHKLEIRYRMTCHDGSLKKNEIKKNIQSILQDEQ